MYAYTDASVLSENGKETKKVCKISCNGQTPSQWAQNSQF